MTNFDFLKKEKKFASFANTAITAEMLFRIDIPSCVFNIRRAMEFAVKWMYSVDSSLVMPYQDNLVTLINTVEFKDIVGNDLYRRLTLFGWWVTTLPIAAKPSFPNRHKSPWKTCFISWIL